jgi:iron complex transport system substrate-binding protein
MIKKFFYPFLSKFLVVAALSFTQVAANSEAQDCSRIVALSPSLVEVVFALGIGGGLVGVSSYSNYPEAALEIPVVGGLMDPNLEAIFSLSPSIVLALHEQSSLVQRLKPLGVRTEVFEHRYLERIIGTVTELAAICEVEQQGQKLFRRLNSRITELTSRVPEAAKQLPKRVLIVIGLPDDEGGIRSLFISGRDGFYNDLVELAGGVNVVKAATLSLPQISQEGLLSLNPDVIIHIASKQEKEVWRGRDLLKSWGSLEAIEAVKRGRVYMIAGDYAVIPGPRFTILLEDLINILWFQENS